MGIEKKSKYTYYATQLCTVVLIKVLILYGLIIYTKTEQSFFYIKIFTVCTLYMHIIEMYIVDKEGV